MPNFNVEALDLNRSGLNIRRIFWLLVAFELLIFLVLYIGDYFLYNNLIFYAYMVGILLTPIFLIIIPLEPTIGLVLMFIATGFDFLGRIAEQSGDVNFNLTYFHLALLVTLVSTFLNLLLRRRTVIRPVNLWSPFILFLFVLSYSLIYTPNFLGGAIVFARIAVMGLIALIVIEAIDKKWKLTFFVWGMILVPVGGAMLTLYQLVTQGSFYAPKVVKMATSLGLAVYRSTGTFSNPNKLACFLMVGIVFAFGMMFVKEYNFTTKLLLFISLIVSSIGILSTFSRAGWLSTLAGLILIVMLHKKWWFFVVFMILVVLSTIVLSIKIPQLWEAIFDRFASIFDPSSDNSSSSRLSLIKSGIWMWQDHPLFGVGLRGFPKMYYDYVDPEMPQILLDVNEPHTIQFEILAEEGIIGLVVATWLFFTVFFHGIRTTSRIVNPFLRNIQITSISLVIAFIVNFTFATDMTNNSFWMIVGLVYAIPFIDRELSEESDEPEASTAED